MLSFVEDAVVRWELYRGEALCDRFPIDQWRLMVTEIETDKEWRDFVDKYKDFVRCYILRSVSDNEEVAFVYLYNESGNFDIVSIHGGGWDRSIKSTMYYYRGLILMISSLIAEGRKVRTSCYIDNIRAFRFLRSVGFVPYMRSQTTIYMWINEKRLKNSSIYKRLK